MKTNKHTAAAARGVIPEMRGQGGGRVINLTNIGAKQPKAQSMPAVVSRAAASSATPPAGPALRRPRLTRRQAARERALRAAAGNSFDPLQYTLRARARRAAGAPAPLASAPPPQAAPTASPPPLRPLVLARPLVRAGGEDYRQHPSRMTPHTREAYWAGSAPAAAPRSTPLPATPPTRKSATAPTPPSKPARSARPRPAAGRRKKP